MSPRWKKWQKSCLLAWQGHQKGLLQWLLTLCLCSFSQCEHTADCSHKFFSHGFSSFSLAHTCSHPVLDWQKFPLALLLKKSKQKCTTLPTLVFDSENHPAWPSQVWQCCQVEKSGKKAICLPGKGTERVFWACCAK